MNHGIELRGDSRVKIFVAAVPVDDPNSSLG
jgi:hypothetical protein